MKKKVLITSVMLLLFATITELSQAQVNERVLIRIEKENIEVFKKKKDYWISHINVERQFNSDCHFFEIWSLDSALIDSLIAEMGGIAIVILEHQSKGTLNEYTAPAIPKGVEYSNYWHKDAINYDSGINCFQNNATSTIAIIDDGVDYTHNDLKYSMRINQGEINEEMLNWLDTSPQNGIIEINELLNHFPNMSDALSELSDGIDNEGNGYIDDILGWNFVDNNNNVLPSAGSIHGTHMAGIAAGLNGIAPKAQIMALKCFDGNTTDIFRVIEAMVYAANEKADVSLCAFGYSDDENQLTQLTDILYDIMQCAENVIFSCSAGNSGMDNDLTEHIPSNFTATINGRIALKNVLSVSATYPDDSFVYSFNMGINTVDVMAPGVDIYSTIPNNGYAAASGTSGAAAITAGVAALFSSNYPQWSPAQIKEAIRTTVRHIDPLEEVCSAGGILNIEGLCYEVRHTVKSATITSTELEQNQLTTVENKPVFAEISLYPNPARNELNFGGITTETIANIYTVNGVLLKTSYLNKYANSMDINSLPVGIYFVQLKTKNEVITKLLVKQ